MPITGEAPIIVIEVNDRMLDVYMDVSIQLKSEVPLTTKRLGHRSRTLAYSKTF
jgi:hypothetical protein